MDFNLGDKLLVRLPNWHAALPARVIAVTDEPGKHLGVEFEYPVQNGHTCDLRGTPLCCLWVLPSHIVSTEPAAGLDTADVPTISHMLDGR